MKWATAFIALTAVARFAGSDIFLFRDPGVALAKPSRNPRIELLKGARAHEMGDSVHCIDGCRPLRGLRHIFVRGPGVALAKPRSTPGFMLTPATRAKSRPASRAEQTPIYLAGKAR